MANQLLDLATVNRRNQTFRWLDLLALSASVACAVALLLAALGAGVAGFGGTRALAQTAGDPPAQETFEGMLSCSHCAAKHSATLGRNAADCVRICAHQGSAFTLVQDEKVYPVRGDLELLKHLAARRVKIEGKLDGDTILISSVTATD